MRLNKFIALATGVSRRKADELISKRQVEINGHLVGLGADVKQGDNVALDGEIIQPKTTQTIMLNKPAGYVSSRRGQGSKTIYDLLPKSFHNLKPAGRLDKDSSGLLVLTNDGQLSEQLTHPRHGKEKTYVVELNKQLSSKNKRQLLQGVMLEDGLSKFYSVIETQSGKYEVKLSEGRNRQVRRTFSGIGFEVKKLHRTTIGPYNIHTLKSGQHKILP